MANKRRESFNVSKWNKKGTFKVVVGIDFGTDGSGIAWAVNDGNEEVFVDQEINDNAKFVDLKTKTNILLDENGEFIAFGREATEQYIRQFEDESDDEDDDQNDKKPKKSASWLYFSQFKMALYKKAIKKQALITRGGPGGNNEEDKNDDDDKKDDKYKTDIKTNLTAANGKKLPSRTVFIAALKFMKEHAFKMFAKKNVEIKDKKEIKWVLTVPAIWSDKSKGLMEQWAIEAGLITNNKVLNQLVICYEPDCASISIQNEIKDYKKLLEQKKNKNNNNNNDENVDKDKEDKPKPKQPKQYLTAGEKYLLLDLGGGTADIACHQVIDDFSVKEVYQPSGGMFLLLCDDIFFLRLICSLNIMYIIYNVYIMTGAWGSSYIDKHFTRLLTDLFPAGWLQKFQGQRPSDYTILMNNFRRSKESFYARDKQNKNSADPSIIGAESKEQSHNITLPVEFIEFLETELEEYNKLQQVKNKERYDTISEYIEKQSFLGTPGKWRLNDDKLELDYAIWKQLFDEVVDQIIDHCKNLLKMETLKNKQCKYICLVGGFSSSKYLQSRIMYELGIKSDYRLIVIVPKRPSLSVVDGAVRLGLKPDYIASRIVRKTYGIKVNAPISRFNLNDLDKDLVTKNRYFNKRANQEYLHNIFHPYVRCEDQINITDKPKTTKFYASKKNIVGIDVYSSNDKNPIFITGKPIARKDVILPSGWDIHQTFPISFFFGDTKIRVFADIDGIEEHEKEIRLEYEF